MKFRAYRHNASHKTTRILYTQRAGVSSISGNVREYVGIQARGLCFAPTMGKGKWLAWDAGRRLRL